MTVRTIYVALVDRKTGDRVRGVQLRRLADSVRADMPRGWATYRGGEYVKAGTRFLGTATDGSTPVIKIRGDDRTRYAALTLLRRHAVTESITNHAREEVTS